MRVSRSTRINKKYVATFEDGARTHFGGAGCGDFILWTRRKGPDFARQKRVAYIKRHGATETWDDPTSAATLSRYILWEKPTMREAIEFYERKFRV